MTRNPNKLTELSEAIGPPSNAERSASAQTGRAQLKSLRSTPLEWARLMHTFYANGQLAPLSAPTKASKTAADQAAVGRNDLAAETNRALTRSENGDRVRVLIRAIRVLGASQHERDRKHAGELGRFLGTVWGLKRAADAAGGSDRDFHRELIERWGDAQLPPEAEGVDEAVIAAVVRRLG